MGQMPAMGEIQTHDRVAWLQQGQKHGEVGLRTTVGLNVGPGGPEQLLRTGDGQILNGIHVLTTAVVPLARQPLGIFVGEHGALGLHDRARREVLARDQLEVGLLTLTLLLDETGNDRISSREVSIDRTVGVQAHGDDNNLVLNRKKWLPSGLEEGKKKLPRRTV